MGLLSDGKTESVIYTHYRVVEIAKKTELPSIT